MTQTTDFGYETVPISEKASRVASVFDSVADRYDLMNDLMSLGLHRAWKRFAVLACGLRPGHRVLDLAGGTGDISALVLPKVGADGEVVLSDINYQMLARGRDRLLDRGFTGRVRYLQADAESLPFPSGWFDCVVIAFGLRNVSRKEVCLRAIFDVLKPGGRIVVLEFSQLRVAALRPLYDAYSFGLLPRLGRLIANDADSYRYLAESIRRHPDQDTLLAMMSDAGFERCRYLNLAGGIVAVHRGYRLD